MAVTSNTGSAQPISGNETAVANIAGGPFDTVSVYAIGGIGGNGNSGLLRYRLYALVGGFQTLIAQCLTIGSNTSCLLEWTDVDVVGGPSTDVEAGGTAYTLTVQDTGPSGTPRDPVTVTLAGVNAFDTVATSNFGTSLTLAPGQEGFLPGLNGYSQKMDVAVDQTNLPPVRVRVYANCGPGSVQAVVRNKALSGRDTTIASVFHAIELPAATQYLVSLTNESQNPVTATLTAASYSVAITAGGVVILGGDVTGPSNANTVTKWRNVTLDAVTMAAPPDASIPIFDGPLAEWRSIVLSGGATMDRNGVITTAPISLAGDVTGLTSANTVIKVNGATVPVGGALTTGNALQVSGAGALSYAPINLAGGANFVTGLLPDTNQAAQTMGGDVTGTTAASTVAKVNGATVPVGGALTTGNALQVSGAGALSYAPINLAGGANFVTGILPSGNQSPQAMGGDVTGTTAASTVAKVNGATVPVGGALTTGNALQVSGAGALSYAPVNLGGGANFVTGTLPAGNQAAQTMGGDVTGTTAASTVAKVNGATVPVGGALTTGNVLQVSGAGALSYAPVNLSGGTNFVTGTLPVASVAPSGANAQLLATEGGVSVWQGLNDLMTQRRTQYWSGGFIGNATAGYMNCSLNFTNLTTGGLIITNTQIGATNRAYCSSGNATATWIGGNDASLIAGSLFRGSGGGAGGFTCFTRFAIENGSGSSQIRAFVGLVANTGSGGPTASTDWSTQTLVGSFGLGTTQTLTAGVYAGNWQIFNNTAGSAPTVTGTGIPIVINHIYDFTIFCAPSTSTMTWTITDVTAATTATGTIGANLPVNTTGLLWQAGMFIAGGGGPTNSFSVVRYVTDSQ